MKLLIYYKDPLKNTRYLVNIPYTFSSVISFKSWLFYIVTKHMYNFLYWFFQLIKYFTIINFMKSLKLLVFPFTYFTKDLTNIFLKPPPRFQNDYIYTNSFDPLTND